MFLEKNRDVVKEIEGFRIKFRYPTITDEINIEAKKNIYTRGQYAPMTLSTMVNAQKALDYVDAISTLSIVARFEDEDKKSLNWDSLVDDEGKEFLMAVYNEFLEWRNSFRKKPEEKSGGEPLSDSKQ